MTSWWLSQAIKPSSGSSCICFCSIHSNIPGRQTPDIVVSRSCYTLHVNQHKVSSRPSPRGSTPQTHLTSSSDSTTMKSFITLTLLAGSALVAYAPGTACKNNNDCTSKCIKSQWVIAATSDGSYQFVCDPTLTGTQYYSSACGEHVPGEDGPERFIYNQAATAIACKSIVGSVSCNSGCVTSGKILDEQSFRDSWHDLCKKKLLGVFDLVGSEVDASESQVQAEALADCS
jgi:hypothetical protein